MSTAQGAAINHHPQAWTLEIQSDEEQIQLENRIARLVLWQIHANTPGNYSFEERYYPDLAAQKLTDTAKEKRIPLDNLAAHFRRALNKGVDAYSYENIWRFAKANDIQIPETRREKTSACIAAILRCLDCTSIRVPAWP